MDDLRRIRGVGDVQAFSSQYAMRIGSIRQVGQLRLSAADALTAVREQNSQSAAGSLADRPLAEGRTQCDDRDPESLHVTEEFGSIILRANQMDRSFDCATWRAWNSARKIICKVWN